MIKWRRPRLIEIIYMVGLILSILVGLVIFKLAEDGKFTWDHLLWIIMYL